MSSRAAMLRAARVAVVGDDPSVFDDWEPESGRTPAWEAPVADPEGRPVMLYVDTAKSHQASWRARGLDVDVIRMALAAVTHRQPDPYEGHDDEERTRWYTPGFGNRAWLRIVVAYRSARGNVVTGVTVANLPPDAQRT